jgi:hypothetical protein
MAHLSFFSTAHKQHELMQGERLSVPDTMPPQQSSILYITREGRRQSISIASWSEQEPFKDKVPVTHTYPCSHPRRPGYTPRHTPRTRRPHGPRGTCIARRPAWSRHRRTAPCRRTPPRCVSGTLQARPGQTSRTQRLNSRQLEAFTCFVNTCKQRQSA